MDDLIVVLRISVCYDPHEWVRGIMITYLDGDEGEFVDIFCKVLEKYDEVRTD